MPSSSPGTRVHFVDVLRLIALAQMVNGHTLHALLDESVRQGPVYARYLWFRGLVSVAFMLVAGLAFHITTLARFDQHKRDPQAVQRRLMRALQIIALGFLLRMPVSALIALDAEALARGLMGLKQIDVLPCIGVSLLVLEALVVISRKPLQVVAACLGLSVLCVFAAAWGASLPAQGAIAFATGWLGPQTGSAFPLLPYSGYIFAGVVLGWFTLPVRAAATTPAQRLLAAACGLFTLAWFMGHVGWLARPVPAGVHSPAFFTYKLAVVTCLVAALAYALRNVRALPQSLRMLSGETLAIYVFHLGVLYGAPLHLQRRIGSSLPLSAAACISAALLLASCAVGLGWHRFKAWQLARPFVSSPRATLLASCFIAACSVLVASRAFAEPPVNTNSGRYAIGGYDAVAYFEEQRPQLGVAEFNSRYRDAVWLFASAAHKRVFDANPNKFAPAYAGYCAYAAAQGRLVSVDPNAWAIVNGRLYLNYSLAIRERWNADRARYVLDADQRWPTLAGTKH